MLTLVTFCTDLQRGRGQGVRPEASSSSDPPSRATTLHQPVPPTRLRLVAASLKLREQRISCWRLFRIYI